MLTELGFDCFAGLGGLHLLEDYAAGVHAVMAGSGFVACNVALWDALTKDSDEAWERYTRMLPLLVFQMASIDTFAAIQKELLNQRGILENTRLRRPGRVLDEQQQAWLANLVERTGVMSS